MTRDGTFLVQDGKIAGGIRNFRFNQGILEMLSNVEMLGPSVRAAGEESFEMVVPPMKVRDFNFSEVTKFSSDGTLACPLLFASHAVPSSD